MLLCGRGGGAQRWLHAARRAKVSQRCPCDCCGAFSAVQVQRARRRSVFSLLLLALPRLACFASVSQYASARRVCSQFRALCYESRRLATSQFKLLSPPLSHLWASQAILITQAHSLVAAICHWAQPIDHSSRACAAALNSSPASLATHPLASFCCHRL